jgi:predicted negative regulator of RcsB-dependent stress response
MAQKKDQEAGDLFLNFYNSYSASDFNDQEYKTVINEISQIDNASIYLVMLKSIYAAESVESNDLQKALTELLNAREILSSKGSEFNVLKEIIDLRIVNIFIDLEDLDRANNILKNTFTIYQTNKLILQGDISAIEKRFDEAKQKYIEALELSENETQKNLINLKISTLTD